MENHEIVKTLREKLAEQPARSAWDKGVKEYAGDLLDLFEEWDRYAEPNGFAKPTFDKKTLLNGADDWSQYSWGGWSLIYNSDIAERLCTPSELTRTKNGERRPNSREEWLDVQARALYQAAGLLLRLYRWHCVAA